MTLTAASGILMATGASANVTPAGNLSAQADTINANINLNSAFIQDLTTGDADVLNATLGATYTANQATILGIETLNLTGAGGSLNVANTTGVTAFNLVNGNVAMTNVGTATPVTINNGFAGNANLQSSGAGAAADFAVTLAGGASTATVAFEDSAAAQLVAGSVVTANVTANTTLARLADDDSAAAAAAGAGDLVVTGAGNLTVADVQFRTVTQNGTGELNLTFTAASASATQNVVGGAGNDTFNFGTTFIGAVGGNDTVNGGAGNDTLAVSGTAAINLGNVTNVENIVVSGATATTVTTVAGNLGLGETLNITGSTMTAALTTAGGASAIYKLNITGSAQNDALVGGQQADTINGGAGNDTITGGTGSDILTGGTGTNVFVFANTDTGLPSATAFDTITDWRIGTNNSIDFGATVLAIANQANAAGAGTATLSAGGIATFNAADATFAQRLVAVENAISGDTAGEFAIWQEGADAYLFISDATGGLSATDVLIKLVGVTVGGAGVTVAGGDITVIA